MNISPNIVYFVTVPEISPVNKFYTFFSQARKQVKCRQVKFYLAIYQLEDAWKNVWEWVQRLYRFHFKEVTMTEISKQYGKIVTS